MLGRPDDAWAALESAVATAEPLDHPFTTAWPMAFKVILLSHRREPEKAQVAAEQLIEFALKEQQVYWLHAGLIVRGWAIACAGKVEEGIAGMREGIAAYSGSGAAVSSPHFYALLAEVLMVDGQLEEAGIELATAFKIANCNNESVAEINLWRLRGKLADLASDTKTAVSDCQRAVEIAKEKGAWGPGLSAALTLHRLSEDADMAILAEFAGHFESNSMTPDMHEASKLLQL